MATGPTPLNAETLAVVLQLRDLFQKPLRDAIQQMGGLDKQVKTTDTGFARMQRNVSLGMSKVAQSITAPVKALMSLKGALVASLGALGAGLSIYGVSRSLNETAREIEGVVDASVRLQIPIKQLSQLRYVARISNVEFEQFAFATKNLTRSLDDAASKAKSEQAQAFRALGIDVEQVNQQATSLTELLPQIADGMQKLGRGRRVNVAEAIFGRGGVAMLTAFDQGGERMRQLFAEAERFGAIITPEMARAVSEYRDNVDRISFAWFGVKAAIVQEVAPVLSALVLNMATTLGRWPERIHNLGAALRESVSLDWDNQSAEARDSLKQLVKDLVGAVTTSLYEFGKLFVISIVKGVQAGIELAAPAIKRMLQDTLASAGMGKFSAQGALQDALENNARRMAEMAELQKTLATPRGQRRGMLGGLLSDNKIQQRIDDLKRSIRDIPSLEKLAEQERAVEVAAQNAGLNDVFLSWGASASAAGVKIKRAFAEIGMDLDEMRQFKRQSAGEPELFPAVEDTNIEAISKGVKSLKDRLLEAYNAGRMMVEELSIRNLRAAGSDDLAARAEVLFRHRTEIFELRKQMGQLAEAVIPSLRAVQAAELQAFDNEQAKEHAKTLASLRREIELMAAADQPDTLAGKREGESQKALLDLRNAYEDDVLRWRDALDQKKISQEQFDSWLVARTQARERQIDDVRRQPKDFSTAFDSEWEKIRDEMADTVERGKQFARDLQQSITSGVQGMIDGLVAGTRSAMDVIRQFLADLLNSLYKAFLEQQVLSFFTSLFTGATGGGYTGQGPGLAAGGIIRMASGGVIPRGASGMVTNGPAIMVGERRRAGGYQSEAVLPLKRGASGDLGVEVAGVRGGGEQAPVIVQFHVNTIDARSFEQYLARSGDAIASIVTRASRRDRSFGKAGG